VRAFIDSLIADGRGAVTVRRIIAVVQGALTAALRDDIIATNPARGVRLPNVDAHEFEPWTPQQVGAFLDHASQHRLGALFEVAVLTGLRRAELVGLRWVDVDLARRELSVRSTRVETSRGVVENAPKTSAGRRVVQLDDAAVGALVAWQIAQSGERAQWDAAWLSSGYVFTYENGEPLRPQYVTRLFDSLRAAADLPEMTLHGLRHMHASLLLASGADIALVSKRLGHSSISITSDIYTHLIGDAARRAAESASALVPRATAQRVHNSGAPDETTEARNLAISA
jgi:integrase